MIYDLLRAYGIPRSSISRLRSGNLDKSDHDNETLWKGKVFFRYAQTGEADLHALIDATESDQRIVKNKPRFVIVRDDEQMLALDTKTRDTLDINLSELSKHAAFFLPWAGIEKTTIENANIADVKAAEKMARLYDEIIKHNELETAVSVRALNVFFSRLLFCFFAEDTEVFRQGQFTNAVASYTQQSGTDVNGFLDQLFEVMNTADNDRGNIAAHLAAFGYVNGKLFAKHAPAPTFSSKARRILLECGELDWAAINPDIFGSMIQAVVHPVERESLGMHYTSVENIMKVLRPLFLDELEEAYEKAEDDARKLQKLLDRIFAIKVFDPACGSGNFLIIAYKEMRRLEHRILQRITELNPRKAGLFKLSGIELDRFYGIEIDDFAHEIALLSLWLAKHQMNVEFKELFGVEISLIPLRDAGSIVSGNAARMDWTEVCPKDAPEPIRVVGNPPYLGSSMQGVTQKEDFELFFGSTNYPRNLDYIALWFLKGSKYISDGRAELAFVTTNSVCQGDHVGLMWPQVLDSGAQISFAYESFQWTNSARGQAGVTCTVIGLSHNVPNERLLISASGIRRVEGINPYLIASTRNTIVKRSNASVSSLPAMLRGSQPTDGGHLILDEAELQDLLAACPSAGRFVKKYVGAEEFLNGKQRYCLWISDDEADAAMSMKPIADRLAGVTSTRRAGSTTAQSLAEQPWRFMQRPHRPGTSIIVPRVSSERREYVPIGFLDEGTVISDAANAIYDAEPWLFGLIQSRMHMVWMRAVAGRMKSDYRYSATLVYNTFPVPPLTAADHEALSAGALNVLAAREASPGKTLAQMYDPDKMPASLKAAHEALDATVDRIYRPKAFTSDEERLEMLFELYETMIAGKDAADA